MASQNWLKIRSIRVSVFLEENLTVSEKDFPVLLLTSNDSNSKPEGYNLDVDADNILHIDVAKMMLEGTDRSLEDEIGSKLFYLMNDVIRYANISKLQNYKILDESLQPKKTLVIIDSLDKVYAFVGEEGLFAFLTIMLNFGKTYNCFVEFVIRDVIDVLPIDLLKDCQTIVATPSLHKEAYYSFFDDKDFLDTILETQDSHLENIVSHFDKGHFLVSKKE